MVDIPSHEKFAQHYNFGCIPINSKTFLAENYSPQPYLMVNYLIGWQTFIFNSIPAIFHEKILEAMKKYLLAGVAVLSTCYSVHKNKL